MITFKKNWLYRYNKWCTGNMFTIDYVNDSESVCPYFWKSLWNVVVVNLLYLSIAHFPAVFGVGIVDNLAEGSLSGLPMMYSSLGAGYLILICAFSGIFGCAYLYTTIADKIGSSKESKPSVVVEYLKAKKNKICPMIKWED